MVGDCCLIIIILLLPPLGVFLMRGCHADFWIKTTRCLTLLGYLPGHLHAFYLMVKRREEHAEVRGVQQAPAGYGAVPQ
ncbi:hypothetical protein BCR43DRAFT_492649 [Syncephalastrum racemosum]|uniref:Plasma membrane proteolipid 3 n=1 Tax=Syncephalastrum racemosum TaxID=13706 RepID=A0A1X2H9C2_SYNRA|nr:hypothetical protein BCR43DRAFT_492649 [Syncephalastrum racemosum]